jgi:hypothetical protein
MSLASTPSWTTKDHELFTSVLKALAKRWDVKVEGVDSDLSRLFVPGQVGGQVGMGGQTILHAGQAIGLCHTKNDAEEVRLCGTLQAMGAQ